MDIITHILSSDFNSANQSQNTPKFVRLTEYLKNIIEQYQLLEGTHLPSTRNLSGHLSVSRSTVIKAYELLIIEGFVEAKKGSGYKILPRQEKNITAKDKVNPQVKYPKISKSGVSFQHNVHLINTTSDKYIAFRPGLPPLDIFPVNQWKKLSNLYWRNIKASSLTYSNSSGIKNLKKNIANYLYLMRGIKCDYEQIIIVSGSLQSLYLLGTALLDRGNAVVMENPTFPNVHSIFRSLEADINAFPVDSEGICLPESNEAFTPKIIHVTPSNHYPTGVKMTKKRKQEVIDWAKQNETIIIENDYDHEVSNWGLKDPTIFEMDNDNRTVYLGTFNRLLHPSIRLGYMVVPYYLLDVITALQKHSHRFVSPYNQIVMSQFIEKNYLFNHIKNVIEVADERKELFTRLVSNNIHESFKLNESATRSLHLLASVPQSYHDKELVDELTQHQLIAHQYSKCFINDEQNGLILGYSAVRKHLMTKKILEMVRTYNDFAQRHL